MGKDSPYRLVTGPDVVKTGTHGTVGAEALGGAITHTTKSGVADLAFENDLEALLEVRRFVDFLPASNREAPPWRPTDDPGDREDRKSVVSGKSVSVRVDLGGRRTIKKTTLSFASGDGY